MDPSDTEADPAIVAEEFSFTYPTGDDPALRALDVEIERGEVLGVLGPVEAGKTSLSMALAGFVPEVTRGHTSGELSVAGRDPRTAADDRVAMVFEDYSSQLTRIQLIDEVIAPLTNRGLPRDGAVERARALLDDVRLETEDEEKYTWEISGGQQQRLAIAAALAIDPEVLIFDTATDMLDPRGREDVADLIASLAGEKTTVVTENDPDALVGIADEVLVLENGERVACGPADEILRDAELLEGVGVGPPLALRVARELGLPGSPITVGEFVDTFGTLPRDATSERARPVDADGGTPVAGRSHAGHPTAGAAGGPVIDVDGVTYEYADGTVAVDDVSLTVHPGEVHALVGGNGAGKSTLSKLLVGLMEPTEGTVRIQGEDTEDRTARTLAESVGIALQNPDEQLSERTVENEIRYPLERRRTERTGPFGLFGTRERYDEAYVDGRVEAVFDLVEPLDDCRDDDPLFLPRGERRLVTTGAALGPDPAGLVLDEPAAGVDATTRRTIVGVIERLRAEGTGIVLVEHDVELVCEVADTVTVLDDGRVARQGPVEEVFAPANWEWLAERYVRPPRVARLARQVGTQALTIEELVATLEPVVETFQ